MVKRLNETFTEEEFKKLIDIKETVRKRNKLNKITWREIILSKFGVINEQEIKKIQKTKRIIS